MSFTNKLLDSNLKVEESKEILDFVKEGNWSAQVLAYSLKVISSSKENNLITSSPFIKYPKEKAEQYMKDYPGLTNFLKTELPKIANNTKKLLMKFTV